MTTVGFRGNEEQRFWRKVRIDDSGCWIWIPNGFQGYGSFGLAREPGQKRNKLIRAHVWSYKRYVGEIHEGFEVDHLCRNPSCVNPLHLEAVPHRINMLRGKGVISENFNKVPCKHGHNNWRYKTTRYGTMARWCATCSDLRIRT